MYLIAIAAGARGDEAAVADFASVTGLTRYEATARLRTLQSSPGILTSFGDAERAESLARALTDRGFPSWTLTPESTLEARIEVLRWEEQADRLVVRGRGDQRYELRCDDVRLLLHGTRFYNRQHHEPFIHLYVTSSASGPGVPTLVFAESSLRHASMDAGLQPTRSANFARTVQQLRQVCTRATYEDRLLSRAQQIRMLGMTLHPETHLDVAIALLARARGGTSPYR